MGTGTFEATSGFVQGSRGDFGHKEGGQRALPDTDTCADSGSLLNFLVMQYDSSFFVLWRENEVSTT